METITVYNWDKVGLSFVNLFGKIKTTKKFSTPEMNQKINIIRGADFHACDFDFYANVSISRNAKQTEPMINTIDIEDNYTYKSKTVLNLKIPHNPTTEIIKTSSSMILKIITKPPKNVTVLYNLCVFSIQELGD